MNAIILIRSVGCGRGRGGGGVGVGCGWGRCRMWGGGVGAGWSSPLKFAGQEPPEFEKGGISVKRGENW